MSRGLALALLLAASLFALAADDQPVQAPYIEVGDCWSYRGENIQNRGPIENYEMCVTFIDAQKDVIAAVATVKSDGREIDVTYSSKLAVYRSLTGLTTPQGINFYRFPLRVGDKYSHEYEFREALRGPNQGKVTWNMTVVGWQDVTVPAGKFRALKLEAQGTIHRYDLGPRTYPATVGVWYAPEVNRHVKIHSWFPDRQSGEELVAYKLNK